ncbi:hypothetical protein HPG69_014695, partial [Diceros bicornis minor]
FQDAISPIIEELHFHDHTLIVFLISSLVLYIILLILTTKLTRTNYEDLSFDSYIIPMSDLKPGELRLLEVDNQVVLPIEITIRILISSKDVLHS